MEQNVSARVWIIVTLSGAIIVCFGAVVAAVISIVPDLLNGEDSSTLAPTSVVLEDESTEVIETETGSSCDQIQNTFPQSLDAVQDTFNLPSTHTNFRLVYEDCGAIATGFIFEGAAEFEVEVPAGGCIDSYSGAYFSSTPTENAFGGLRVYDGIVRATGVTYRTAWCLEHP